MNRQVKVYYGRFIKLMKDIVDRSITDNFTGIGAQVSYYFILAFFPFLVFLIALISFTRISSDDFIRNLSGFMPGDVYDIVSQIIRNTVQFSNTTLLSLGAFTAIWVASNGIESLVIGFNCAYDLQETRPYWKVKLLAIFMTFALAIVYLLSIVMVVFGGLIARKVFGFLHVANYFFYIWEVLRYIFPIITMFIFFILIYNYLPSKKVGIKKVLPGSVFATIGWMVFSQLFSYYIENFVKFTQAYGSLGGIIVLLLWLYWCGILIMLGAELNAALYYFRIPKKLRTSK